MPIPEGRGCKRNPLTQDGADELSVLSTSVTKQTGDMVYSEARRLRILSIWAHTTMLYALCRFSFTYRKRASMGGFIPLPVENSFTCRIPVRRLRAGSMLQFSG
jgi:hypothetical protein